MARRLPLPARWTDAHRVDLWLEDSKGEVQVEDLQEVNDQAGHQAACRETTPGPVCIKLE